jgi:hypothetical protein
LSSSKGQQRLTVLTGKKRLSLREEEHALHVWKKIMGKLSLSYLFDTSHKPLKLMLRATNGFP